jgi:P4 family phage/plasmid primase-like protien
VTEPLAEVHKLRLDPAEFFDAHGPMIAKLGLFVRQLGHVRIGADLRLWHYAAGAYHPDGELFVRNAVRSILGPRFRMRHASEVLAWIRSEYPSIDQEPTDDRINCASGLLDWRTETLTPHTPEFVSINQLPAAWNPNALCPAIEKFLHEVLPDAATVALLYEILGAALYGDNRFKKAVLLLGPGDNGKSVLLAMVAGLFGRPNVSAVSLQALADNRFAGADLYGKLANVAGDLDARDIKRSDLFKQATGGDILRAEWKHQGAFKFVSRAFNLFSANEPPLSSDQTEGWFGRWIILPMQRVFTDAEKDPGLKAKLTTPAELEGLLVHAVRGLKKLMERGRFELPESVQQAGEEYRDRLDTARAFTDEACVLQPYAWTPRPKLYLEYRKWTLDSGRRPLSRASFYEHLLRTHRGIQVISRNGTRGFEGIGLLAPDDASPTYDPDDRF